jgi:hypothetical protein
MSDSHSAESNLANDKIDEQIANSCAYSGGKFHKGTFRGLASSSYIRNYLYNEAPFGSASQNIWKIALLRYLLKANITQEFSSASFR